MAIENIGFTRAHAAFRICINCPHNEVVHLQDVLRLRTPAEIRKVEPRAAGSLSPMSSVHASMTCRGPEFELFKIQGTAFRVQGDANC